MFEFIVAAGPAGVSVVIAAAVLLIAGVLMVALSCTRKAFALYAVLVWFPLLLGVMGTRAALNEMEHSPLVHSDAIGPRNQQRVRAELTRPLSLGIGATVLLLPLAVIGLATARKRKSDAKDDQSNPVDRNPSAG